jgi:ParB/RepB/Spo0J family partition protein
MTAGEADAVSPESRTGPEWVPEVPIGEISIVGNVRELDRENLGELTKSIAENGILNPLTVTHTVFAHGSTPDEYRLVSGHRRLAAARLAKLKVVPVHVLELTPTEVLEIQLTENLQRTDLTALEEAAAYKAYLDAGHTQGDLAARISKSQSYVSTRVKLLELPDKIQKQVETGKISESHAEILARAPPAIVSNLAASVVGRDMSVRQLERDAGWKTSRYNEAQKEKKAFAALIAKSKFTYCPVKTDNTLCERRPRRLDYRGAPWVTCGLMDHVWNLNTKAVPAQEKTTARQDERKEPPKPALPSVDPETPFALSPEELAVLLQVGSPKYTHLTLDRGHRTSTVTLRFEVGRALPKELRGFTVDSFQRGKAFMDGCESWEQQTDGTRRKLAESKAYLEQWAAKLAGKPTRKGKK